MKEFFDYFVTSNAIALAVAVIIFIVTVILLFRRLIPFTLTLFLLFVAVMSGIIISNHEIVRERLFSSKVKGEEVAVGAADTGKKVAQQDNLLHSKEQIVEAFEQIMHGWCRNVQNETIKATASTQARIEQYADKHDELIAILQDINLKLDLQQDEITQLKGKLQTYKNEK